MPSWNRGKSKVRDWLEANVSYDGEGCLVFPFGRDPRGYGQVMAPKGGKILRAHRYMCELVNGPPPMPEYHAAHSCGNGHLGCVHPKHLSWETGSQNQKDRAVHGTERNGGYGSGGKLTWDEKEEIRRLRGAVTQRELAKRFGVADSTIRGIQSGRWGNRINRRDAVLRVLRASGEPLSAKEIAAKGDIPLKTLGTALGRLAAIGTIKRHSAGRYTAI